MSESAATIVWTDYMRYRAMLRGFDLAKIESIVRYSSERYVDSATGRLIAVGRHNDVLVLVPYEAEEGVITPITIHVATRGQIRLRLSTGRFTHE